MIPTSRKEALALGAAKYRNGKPCPEGHVSDRYSKNGACVLCALTRSAARGSYYQAHYLANRERRLAAQKKHYEANRERRIQSAAGWAENNRERRREIVRAYNRKSRLSPSVRLNDRVRSGMSYSLQRAGTSKRGRRWESLVGYKTADLVAHIERQFVRGMTWENMSEWHIDHILPLASFVFSDASHPEFRAAWALTNLRPLWSEQNLAKRAQRTHLL